MQGTCVLCRARGDGWDHAFPACRQRFEFFEARRRAKEEARGGLWIAPYHACYWCYNPQAVCPRADPDSGCQSCLYADVVMPLCYGVFDGAGAEQWLYEQFQQRFRDVDDFLAWCGQATSFGGGRAIWAVRVAAAALIQFELY